MKLQEESKAIKIEKALSKKGYKTTSMILSPIKVTSLGAELLLEKYI